MKTIQDLKKDLLNILKSDNSKDFDLDNFITLNLELLDRVGSIIYFEIVNNLLTAIYSKLITSKTDDARYLGALLKQQYTFISEEIHQGAFKIYKELAKKGYIRAEHQIGYCYYTGQGVKIDYAKAVKWYRRAADKCYARAQTNLGFCYKVGEGVPENDAEAVEWFSKAAKQGYGIAQNCLANYYHNKLDYNQATKWYAKALKNHYLKAQEYLIEKFNYNLTNFIDQNKFYEQVIISFIDPFGAETVKQFFEAGKEDKAKRLEQFKQIEKEIKELYKNAPGINQLLVSSLKEEYTLYRNEELTAKMLPGITPKFPKAPINEAVIENNKQPYPIPQDLAGIIAEYAVNSDKSYYTKQLIINRNKEGLLNQVSNYPK